MPPPSDDTYLITILEVSKEDRVQCQAQGCGHAIYKRIHVLRENGSIKVVGSECFKRLYAELPPAASVPRFGSDQSRRLNAEEREALVNNTQALVAMLEIEYQDAERARLVRAEAMRVSLLRLQEEKEKREQARAKAVFPLMRRADPSAPEMAKLRQQAKLRLQPLHPGVDLDSPGFSGLVTLEVRKMLREMDH